MKPRFKRLPGMTSHGSTRQTTCEAQTLPQIPRRPLKRRPPEPVDSPFHLKLKMAFDEAMAAKQTAISLRDPGHQ